MLGSAVIFLQPGSARKQANKGKFSQQFVFEMVSDKNFTAGERLFFLEGPRQHPHQTSRVNYGYFEGDSSQYDTYHNGRYRSLCTVKRNLLNHLEVESFQYNTFHRGRNMFLGTFPISKVKHL